MLRTSVRKKRLTVENAPSSAVDRKTKTPYNQSSGEERQCSIEVGFIWEGCERRKRGSLFLFSRSLRLRRASESQLSQRFSLPLRSLWKSQVS